MDLQRALQAPVCSAAAPPCWGDKLPAWSNNGGLHTRCARRDSDLIVIADLYILLVCEITESSKKTNQNQIIT